MKVRQSNSKPAKNVRVRSGVKAGESISHNHSQPTVRVSKRVRVRPARP